MHMRGKSLLSAPHMGLYDKKVSAACCAERVKVVVRVRPPFEHETGGAVKIAPDGKALVLYRECGHSRLFRLHVPLPKAFAILQYFTFASVLGRAVLRR